MRLNFTGRTYGRTTHNITSHPYSLVGRLKRGPRPSPETRSHTHHNGRHPRQEKVSRMKSWTSLGPDMIQMSQLLMGPTQSGLPTVLIMKDPQKGTISSNYWPITCFCMTCNLLSSFIAAKMSRHVDQYISRAQKGVGSNTRGSKHQLLVSRVVSRDCKTKKSNLSGLTTRKPVTQCHLHRYWCA